MARLALTSRFTSSLQGDPLETNVTRQVHGALWSRVKPTPVSAPSLVAWSREVADSLKLTEQDVRDLVPVLAGNQVEGTTPWAANYGGHQFGNWAGQLGDGRAINLGELNGLELQLKGAGPTPYSRRGDGRAVLRSSIREFLCSEAMFHLGVPTTRALSLVATGDRVMRDMFYDGRPELEPGAIVCRVAPSFLRFGNFELCASRDDVPLLRALTQHTLDVHFPGLKDARELLAEVARRTASLMAHWQTVGFVHGVMNTDNMSMLGLTIDYGPYGWLDDFDPSWTPNTTDAGQRRYRYGNQPNIGLWNVERLGVALLPLFDGDENVVLEALREYQQTYEREAGRRFSAKFGLAGSADDVEVVHLVLSWMSEEELDFTNFFRALSSLVTAPRPTSWPAVLSECFYGTPPAAHLEQGLALLQRWWDRVAGDRAEVARVMNRTNPRYVMRNYLAQQVIDSAHEGQFEPVLELLDVMRRPFDDQPGRERFAQKRPEWARTKAGCSALSCSS